MHRGDYPCCSFPCCIWCVYNVCMCCVSVCPCVPLCVCLCVFVFAYVCVFCVPVGIISTHTPLSVSQAPPYPGSVSCKTASSTRCMFSFLNPHMPSPSLCLSLRALRGGTESESTSQVHCVCVCVCVCDHAGACVCVCV